MKEIRIFIASSIVEFEHDRLELMQYISQLNNEYIPKGIVFNLVD